MIRQRDDRPLPRVLCPVHLDPSHKFGSLEEQLLFLARAFHQRDSLFLPLFVRLTGQETADHYRAEGLAVEALDLERFSRSRLGQLLGHINRERIDAVHWQFYPLLGNTYVWFVRLLVPRVRHYYTDHFSRYGAVAAPVTGLRRFAKRMLFDRYHKIVGVSGFVADCLRDQGVSDNLSHKLHFINTERFKPDPEARERVRRERQVGDRFVILATGQLIAYKGLDVAIRALAELPPEVVLWLVGDGEQREELRSLCQQLGVADRVCFLGMQRFVQPFMQAADVLACPSRWREAAGLVNLEAQACGLPVIASAVGGIPEYVEHGRSGLLFPPEDHSRMAAYVRTLLEDAALRRRFAGEARQLALERFSPEARLSDHLELYQSPL